MQLTKTTEHKIHAYMTNEMGPVRPNAIQKTVRTAHLSVHNFSTQYNTEQF